MKHYRLTGADGRDVLSETPGTLGGHRGTRVYGRFDCPAALRALGAATPTAVAEATEELKVTRQGNRVDAAQIP
jgi:hypothetical protein